jgi:hypothetical protein
VSLQADDFSGWSPDQGVAAGCGASEFFDVCILHRVFVVGKSHYCVDDRLTVFLKISRFALGLCLCTLVTRFNRALNLWIVFIS